MKMRWLYLVFGALLTISLLIGGCAQPTSTPTPVPSSKPTSTPTSTPTQTTPTSKPTTSTLQPIEFRWAIGTPAIHLTARAVQKTIDQITTVSKNQIKVNFFPAEQLLKSTELFGGVSAGRVEIVGGAFGAWEGDIPEVQIAGLFGLWKSYEHRMSISDTLANALQPLFAKKGVYLFGESPQTMFSIPSKKGVMNTPADLKGQKIRVPSKTTGAFMEAAGASPVYMGPQDQYTALQKGTVDSTVITVAGIRAYHLEEVTKFVTPIPALGMPNNAVLANLKWWQGLPKEYQDIIRDSVKQNFLPLYHQWSVDEENAAKVELVKTMTLGELTPAQVAAWNDMALPVTRKIVGNLGPEAAKILDLITK